MRLTSYKPYLIVCLIIAAAVIVLKPIYTRSFNNIPNAFAPTHITIATASPCESYALPVMTNKLKLDFDIRQDPIRFYSITEWQDTRSTQSTRTAPPYICALARNTITAPITSLHLRASKKAMQDISFLSITMGSKHFYLNADDISKALVPNKPSPESSKIVESTTIDPNAYLIDLSRYKLSNSSSIFNFYGSTFYDSALGWLYYFLSPQFLPMWLLCAFLWITLRRDTPINLYQWRIGCVALCVILAFLLRLYHYDSFGLWGDELYSVGVVGYPDGDFLSVFRDPGNPPFYNFLLKLWLHCFGYTDKAAKIFSVVIGSLGVVSMYLLLRDHALDSRGSAHKAAQAVSHNSALSLESSLDSSRNLARDFDHSNTSILIPLLGAFFYAISFVAIGAAHEVRGYVLELALLPLVVYFLLHFLKAPKVWSALGYVAGGAMVCNTHYFGVIMITAGFIASAVFLWQDTELDTRTKYKRLAILFALDCLIASALLPYLAITAFSQAITDTSFNTWIPKPSLNLLLQYVPQILGNASGVFIFIVLFLLIPTLKNRFLTCCAMLIVLGVLLPFIASFIRPFFFPKYAVYATYAFVLALCATALVLFAKRHSNASVLIVLGVCALSVSLLDHNVQPIGIGDNSRAKFSFITQDSHNEARYLRTDSGIYIADLNFEMAFKERQYAIYALKPNAEFLRIDEKALAAKHFRKGDILYLDVYYTSVQKLLPIFAEKGARIYPIAFGINVNKDLREYQDIIYKVVF